jgi:lipoprotein releasing system ATP-binding protein
MSFIEVKNLKKIYQTEEGKVEALKGVNFSMEKGDMIAIMGPSGSGKSTFLHLLGAIDIPTEGEIFIKGKNIYKMKDDEKATFRNKNIGFVFQFHYLLPEFTALENVMIPKLLYEKNEKEVRKNAIEILEKLNLGDRLNHKPSQLSGGQQQRVAIARALINNPDIIIADEPTGNLDSENTKTVMEIFKKLNTEKKVSIVIATHDIDIAKYCYHTYYMKDGVLYDNKT